MAVGNPNNLRAPTGKFRVVGRDPNAQPKQCAWYCGDFTYIPGAMQHAKALAAKKPGMVVVVYDDEGNTV